MDGDVEPMPVIESAFNDWFGRISPDGRFLAYDSDETGQREVYIQPLEGMRPVGGRRRVSVAGGTDPSWRSDSRELFFLSRGMLMASAMTRSDDILIEIGTPTALFSLPNLPGPAAYSAAPDGERFIAVTPTSEGAGRSATVILNWAAGLEEC